MQIVISRMMAHIPSDLERWFDKLVKGDAKTAALWLAGVRAVYKALEKMVPESSPFNDLEERLEKKLKGSPGKRFTPLRESELRSLLRYLKVKNTP